MTKQPNLSSILPSIPKSLRDELITCYNEIVRNYRERRWEPSELNGGKLCEAVYTILKGTVDGSYPAHSSKPRNFLDACQKLEQATEPPFSRSLRIQIPRMLIALYEIRNNRGVGHIGGDVNPNHMDAVAVLYMSKWTLSELIRLFHGVTPALASTYVDAIVDRTLPVVWEVFDKLRILRTDFTMVQKTLVFLYHRGTAVSEEELFTWVEHSNASIFRKDVLLRLHKRRVIEYDKANKIVIISPLGIREVEEDIDLDF